MGCGPDGDAAGIRPPAGGCGPGRTRAAARGAARRKTHRRRRESNSPPYGSRRAARKMPSPSQTVRLVSEAEHLPPARASSACPSCRERTNNSTIPIGPARPGRRRRRQRRQSATTCRWHRCSRTWASVAAPWRFRRPCPRERRSDRCRQNDVSAPPYDLASRAAIPRDSRALMMCRACWTSSTPASDLESMRTRAVCAGGDGPLRPGP